MKANKKILIIEDDAGFIQPLKILLARQNWELKSALDGQSGLAAVSAEAPDLILLDLVLPKMDGFAVLQKLKTDKKTKNIPVIIISNLAREEEIKRGLELGAVDYFVKTRFSIGEVVEKIGDILKQEKPSPKSK